MSFVRGAVPLMRKSLMLPRLRYINTSSRLSSQAGSGSDNVEVSVDNGVALLRLKKAPVNSMNQAMLTDLNIALEKLENDRTCRGLIITSVFPRLFCAGLDIQELYQPKKDNLVMFWRSFQDFWKNLYGSRLVTVAAINGHAPAGGCMISLSCDHRVMAAGKYTIGLNEVLLGFMAPLWLSATMINTIGFRESERALKLGLLYSPEEALKVNLVDEVVPETEVIEAARKVIAQYLSVPDYARQLTKSVLRKPTLDTLVGREEEDTESVVKVIMSSETQKRIGEYLQALKSKKK